MVTRLQNPGPIFSGSSTIGENTSSTYVGTGISSGYRWRSRVQNTFANGSELVAPFDTGWVILSGYVNASGDDSNSYMYVDDTLEVTNGSITVRPLTYRPPLLTSSAGWVTETAEVLIYVGHTVRGDANDLERISALKGKWGLD